MELKSYDQILDMVSSRTVKTRMAVAAAADLHSIEAAIMAYDKGMVDPYFVGDETIIKQILKDMGKEFPDDHIVHAVELPDCAEKAVALVREGKADFILKGKIDTGILLKAVVNKEHGLGTGNLMSHFTLFDVPNYHKLLAAVDGGMVTYPDLEQKKGIIINTVETLRKLGVETPKVGVLACIEKVNPKMPETLDADALQKMNEAGEIPNCIVEGPISYDCALRKDIADFKGLESKIAGDVDILVAPNIHAGNIMGKMFAISVGAKMAGCIVGAKCPIAMVSRGSSAEEKFLSICLSAAAAVK